MGTLARARPMVWLAGAALSLSWYFRSAIPHPHRTPLGVERRLFGLADGTVRLMESPAGGRWALTEGGDDASEGSVMGIWDALPEAIHDYRWPPSEVYHPPPRLAPFQLTGTWRLDGNCLRRVWDHEAGGWLDERHLWLSVIGYPLGPVVLDLSSGRTVTVSDEDVKQARSEQQWREWWADQGLPFALSSALEELPPDFAGGWDYLRPVVERAGVYVVYTKDRDDEPVALYAVSDDPAPRILRLTRNARPLALSRDGRTLFFERDQALWRLDLRKPLWALVAEVPVPELPDPLKAGVERRGYPREQRAPAPGSPAGARREESHGARIE
jgi:hypothetical protein